MLPGLLRARPSRYDCAKPTPTNRYSPASNRVTTNSPGRRRPRKSPRIWKSCCRCAGCRSRRIFRECRRSRRTIRPVAADIACAKFDAADMRFSEGLEKWIDSLGTVRSARFFVLPRHRVRYEIASSGPDGLQYRVGTWKQTWEAGRLARFEPIEETLVTSPQLLFQDVTSRVFGNTESFQRQLLRGVPFWRARLDSASGIDVYGNNGIAVGDIDGDGLGRSIRLPAGRPAQSPL